MSIEQLETEYQICLFQYRQATTEEQKRAAAWQVANAWQRLEECKAMTNQNNKSKSNEATPHLP